eukprot:1203911-Ditylum_brightwellii.AAC.1
MTNCHAVIHAATPLNIKFGSNHDGRCDIFEPAIKSTSELLACLARHSSTVSCLVLTSSMSSMAPRPEPTVKDESHWSDPKAQQGSENWYGCTKTTQELMVRDWVRQAKETNVLSPSFLYAAICPTM